MASIDKNVLGLLNGIAKREYYGEEGITDSFLREELFEDMDESTFELNLNRYKNLMKTLVISDMDFRQLDAFLTSQTKRREGAMTEDQAAAVSRFWKNHKTKIHNVVVERSNFGNRLKQTNWRIDLKMHSRHLDQINTPVAIYELELEKQGLKKVTEKIQFEMDAEQLDETLRKIQQIKERISQFGDVND